LSGWSGYVSSGLRTGFKSSIYGCYPRAASQCMGTVTERNARQPSAERDVVRTGHTHGARGLADANVIFSALAGVSLDPMFRRPQLCQSSPRPARPRYPPPSPRVPHQPPPAHAAPCRAPRAAGPSTHQQSPPGALLATAQHLPRRAARAASADGPPGRRQPGRPWCNANHSRPAATAPPLSHPAPGWRLHRPNHRQTLTWHAAGTPDRPNCAGSGVPNACHVADNRSILGTDST